MHCACSYDVGNFIMAKSVYGTSAADYLSSPEEGSVLSGGSGSDRYFVVSSDDVVVESAGGGTDTVETWRESYKLGANIENLKVLGAGITGIGNGAANVITGGNGSQTLFGAGGNDTLTGGGGNDIFVVRAGYGSDTVTDFQSGDVLKLAGYGLTRFADVMDGLRQEGSSTVLRLNSSESVRFLNTSLDDFKSDNFQYSLDRSQLTQTFTDNFDALSLQSDGGTWRTWHAVNNGEEAFLNPKNATGINPFSINNGVLNIHAAKASASVEAITGKDYTSGILSTRDSFSQTYGYFEMRADLPSQNGVCPAFWLLPANGNWPPELDVMEQIGDNPSKVVLTAHSNSSGTHTRTGVSSWVDDSGSGMHTYGVLWTKENLVWYIDGVEAFRAPTPADMHQPMYMVTSLAVGGSWAGTPDADFVSADFAIDYVRAYQLNSELGTDKIVTGSQWSLTLDSTAHGLVLTGSLDINGTGNTGDNTLVGNTGNNVLNGGAGSDVMTGGAGNDTYILDNGGDTVIEGANGGADTVNASVSYVLGANVETLVLTGTGDTRATGNTLNNTIHGNSGNNAINGGAGADTMAGHDGNDTYYVDNLDDTVTEWSGEGVDTVYASVDYELGQQVERLFLSGGNALKATGNGMDNVILGNSAANVIDGKGGADRMMGGAGNDTYYLNNDGDTVVEWSNGGNDTVYSQVSVHMANNVENLIFTGTWHGELYGNVQNNRIYGNVGADTIDGAAGADVMAGGKGNDSYVVDNTGDVVTEWSGEGTDTVYASVSYTLSTQVEHLALSGRAVTGAGNALNNVITGSDQHNVLDGGDGADILNGGDGADTLYGGRGNDIFVFATGSHTDSAAYDTIEDFARGDKIDLSKMSEGAMRFIDTAAFTGHAGEVQLSATGGGVMIRIDLNGDSRHDSQIFLDGVDLATLQDSGADFWL
jgi:Ca2+-binding RTX toxin-like protein